jgi:hypothetical protein
VGVTSFGLFLSSNSNDSCLLLLTKIDMWLALCFEWLKPTLLLLCCVEENSNLVQLINLFWWWVGLMSTTSEEPNVENAIIAESWVELSWDSLSLSLSLSLSQKGQTKLRQQYKQRTNIRKLLLLGPPVHLFLFFWRILNSAFRVLVKQSKLVFLFW